MVVGGIVRVFLTAGAAIWRGLISKPSRKRRRKRLIRIHQYVIQFILELLPVFLFGYGAVLEHHGKVTSLMIFIKFLPWLPWYDLLFFSLIPEARRVVHFVVAMALGFHGNFGLVADFSGLAV